MRSSLLALIACSAVFANLAAAPPAPEARIARFSGDRAGALSYTFDDNLRDQYTVALPMLNEAGFKATFFVIPGVTVDTPGQGREREKQKRAWGGISWPELKEIASQGHEIASHSWSHPNLKTLSPEALDAELKKACDSITAHIGTPPLTLAFPYNASTPEVQAAALKYHVACRSYQDGTSEKSTVESLNAWADKQVAHKSWGVMMTHNVAAGYVPLKDPEILRAHFKYVKSHDKDLWVDTFANIARYARERDAAQLTFTAENNTATCTLTTPLDPKLYNVPLTIIIPLPNVASAEAKRESQNLPVHIAKDAISFEAAPSTQSITITWK